MADAISVEAAVVMAYLLSFKQGPPLVDTAPPSLDPYTQVAYFGPAVFLTFFALAGLYDGRDIQADSNAIARLVTACSAGSLAVVSISFFDANLLISPTWLLVTWFTSFAFVASVRMVLRRLVQELRRRGYLCRPAAIIGTNPEARALADQLLAQPASGLSINGFIDPSLPPGTQVVGNLAVLGDLQTLGSLVRQRRVQEIVVAASALDRTQLLSLYRLCGREAGVNIRLSSGLYEILATQIRVEDFVGVALMTPERVRITGVDAILKTVVDYVGAACGLVLVWPILVVVAALVKLDSPGPVLHRRRVLGVAGKPFDAFKFRTMVVNADFVLAHDAGLRQMFEAGYKLQSDPRVTRIGRFLRHASLDELPQLFNVLRGEMSLVGPRMIAPDEASRYGPWQFNLLTVKPGITGPWQVRGRNTIPYDERVRLSMQYVRNYSIWLDLALLVRTIPVVLLGRGAY
jgi:exopolysaccharide biosynthesis polyprenyl glycosylphosphotransferase